MMIKYEKNFEDAKMVREQVFMQEQGFENEFDEIDQKAVHVTIYEQGNVVGCARTYTEENENEIHIGRIAILKPYRHLGYGSKIVKACESQYDSQMVDFILSSQYDKRAFYQSLGYQERGDIYLDEMVPHIEMIKKHKD